VNERFDGTGYPVGLAGQTIPLPARIVALEEVDQAVARHYRLETAALEEHGPRAGAAKAVAVELAYRLADLSGRAIVAHYGVGSGAVNAIHVEWKTTGTMFYPPSTRSP